MAKKVGIGCGAIVAVFIVIAIIASMTSGGGNDASPAPSVAESSQPAASGSSAPASSSAAPSASAKPKDNNVHAPLAANTKIQVEEGKTRVHELTILEIQDPAVPDNEFEKPSDGNRYWGIKVEVVNVGTDTIHTGSWKLRGANDFEYDEAFTTIQPRLNPYTDLTAGGKAAGWVIFELPSDVQPKWLRYDPNQITGKDLYFDAQQAA